MGFRQREVDAVLAVDTAKLNLRRARIVQRERVLIVAGRYGSVGVAGGVRNCGSGLGNVTLWGCGRALPAQALRTAHQQRSQQEDNRGAGDGKRIGFGTVFVLLAEQAAERLKPGHASKS